MSATTTDPTVTTWADGFGRWHARIIFPTVLGDVRQARQMARRAIRAELEAREVIGAGWRLRLAMTDPADAMPAFVGGPTTPPADVAVLDFMEA